MSGIDDCTIAAWLSKKRVVGMVMVPKTSERRLHNYSTSFILWVAATYLLSVVESKTISCCLEDHETVPPSMRNV